LRDQHRKALCSCSGALSPPMIEPCRSGDIGQLLFKQHTIVLNDLSQLRRHQSGGAVEGQRCHSAADPPQSRYEPVDGAVLRVGRSGSCPYPCRDCAPLPALFGREQPCESAAGQWPALASACVDHLEVHLGAAFNDLQTEDLPLLNDKPHLGVDADALQIHQHTSIGLAMEHPAGQFFTRNEAGQGTLILFRRQGGNGAYDGRNIHSGMVYTILSNSCP
jgi:hypothetical protein